MMPLLIPEMEPGDMLSYEVGLLFAVVAFQLLVCSACFGSSFPPTSRSGPVRIKVSQVLSPVSGRTHAASVLLLSPLLLAFSSHVGGTKPEFDKKLRPSHDGLSNQSRTTTVSSLS